MAVSAGYLTKLRRAVRHSTNADVDAELTDIIEECRLDLQKLGVVSAVATSETDSLILGAVRCYVRWKFGLSNEDAEMNREDYYSLRDELRHNRDYVSYAITFTVEDAATDALADAYVCFGGVTKQTDSSGVAIFYYINAGVNQSYEVWLSGYVSQDVDLDVTATAGVTVTMEAS